MRCGCVTDTYSHLSKLLKIQNGIKKCLIQAKIGEIEGSYCQRLLSQSTCDIFTSFILPNVLKSEYGEVLGYERKGAVHVGDVSKVKESIELFEERYKNTDFLSKSGFAPNQLINKACVASLSGNWDVFETNLLSGLEENEIEPTVGNPFPESKVIGYNPIKQQGQMTIEYRFTQAVLSGGSQVISKVSFICDSSQPNGEYCPIGRTYSEKFKKTLVVGEKQSRQDTIVLKDKEAKNWYNILKIDHTYTINGKSFTIPTETQIIHKGTISEQCNFSLDTGFNCKRLNFDTGSLVSKYVVDKEKSFLIPKSSTSPIYGKNQNIYLNLEYSILGEGVGTTDKIYSVIECKNGDETISKSYPYEFPFTDNFRETYKDVKNINEIKGLKIISFGKSSKYLVKNTVDKKETKVDTNCKLYLRLLPQQDESITDLEGLKKIQGEIGNVDTSGELLEFPFKIDVSKDIIESDSIDLFPRKNIDNCMEKEDKKLQIYYKSPDINIGLLGECNGIKEENIFLNIKKNEIKKNDELEKLLDECNEIVSNEYECQILNGVVVNLHNNKFTSNQ